MPRTIEFAIVQGDVTTFDADVLILKYAPGISGAFKAVSSLVPIEAPADKQIVVEPTRGALGVKQVVIFGVRKVKDFRYDEIRQFSVENLQFLHENPLNPPVQHIITTVHGVNYGLDEYEALLNQFTGFASKLQDESILPMLRRITIVEKDPKRVERLQLSLANHLKDLGFAQQVVAGVFRLQFGAPITRPVSAATDDVATLERATVDADSKPYAFVAMPFKDIFEDTYYYGIEAPVRAAGLLCERSDKDFFTGDIMNRVRERIANSAVLIADLTEANPNVYLEVGYAWGLGRPTILAVRDKDELKFDVMGQRCLIYNGSIKTLEKMLKKELEGLIEKGIVKV